jgi:DNA-binding FadR family transcriptional regulator
MSRVEIGIEKELRVPRASDVLADHLRTRILNGEFEPGTFLPTERDLAAQSGLGRSSVREALKTLEIQGLIAVRSGRNGGSEVIRPTPETLARSVGMFIRGSQVRLTALIDVRRIIEPACAELAAERRDDDDLRELATLNEAMSGNVYDTPEYLRANVDWHIRVAIASHSELLAGLLMAISEAVLDWTDLRRLVVQQLREETIYAHARILEAIADGDRDAAGRRMRKHIEAYGAAVSEVGEEALGNPPKGPPDPV